MGTSPVKKRQGEFTLEDYLALPDDIRVELIDGYFYEMAAPHVVHQLIAGQIGRQMLNYIDQTKGSCKPISVPVHRWNDEFSVDFTKVYEDIKDYLD